MSPRVAVLAIAITHWALAQPSPARVSILEFSSKQCSACVTTNAYLKQLQVRYGTDLTLTVKEMSEHAAEASALGVTTLPALFINGRRLDGPVDLPTLSRVIDVSLGKLVAGEAVKLNLDTTPRLGNTGLPEVTVFSDFQCPYCSSLAPMLAELAKSGEAAIRFKHFPLSFHAKAPGAHRAAWAAGQQGKFWQMHDRIFAAPSRLDAAAYEEYARSLGLDLTRFQQDLATEPAALKADVEEGNRVGVEGTPSLFVNGRPFLGRPSLENLRLAIQSVGGTPVPAIVELQPTILAGNKSSRTTLEWFFDAQSDLTRASATALRELLKTPDVQVIARHLPMPFHPGSRTTHQALVLAHQQGKFWPYLDLLLSQPSEPDADRLKALAMRAGLNTANFAQALDQAKAASHVESDLRRAQALSVRGVPTFVLNGKALAGIPTAASLQAAILLSQTAQPGGSPQE